MILYLDTSSLIKLYVEEDGSETVEELVWQATAVSTSVIAYPEARSAFARLLRDGRFSEAEFLRVKTQFEEDWNHLVMVEVSLTVWRHAGQLVEAHGLRGFDGVHLASFLELAGLEHGRRVRFSSFDRKLQQAADETTTRLSDGEAGGFLTRS